MPCDSISAALPQRFAPTRCAPAAPWLSPDCLRISADSPVGKKSRTEGGPRYFRQRRKLQQAGGRVQGFPHDASRIARQRPRLAPFCASASLFFRAILPQFPRCFSAVATVAKALQVGGITEHSPVALVVADVIHVRGPRPDAMPSTLTAPRLPKELLTAQRLPVLCPVHPAPGLRLLAPLLGLWLVLCAVPAGHQPIAARV